MGTKPAIVMREDQTFFTTSDNSRYILNKDQEPTELIKHCIKNDLKLFDSEGQEIKLKKKNERSTES